MKVMKRHDNKPELRTRLSEFFDIDNLFPTDWLKSEWFNKIPAANVKELDHLYEIELAVPNMDKKDFNLKFENGCLVISAEKEEETKEDLTQYTRREWNWKSFSRTFELPETAMPDDIKAVYKNGMLKITIPKKEEARNKPTKNIPVQ